MERGQRWREAEMERSSAHCSPGETRMGEGLGNPADALFDVSG